jgi:uncharacterized protein (DUF169 family)
MPSDFANLGKTLGASLGGLRFVAVAYLDAPPAGVQKFAGSVPSSCSFWSLAARGDAFYTVPSDHLNCAVGAYTHAIDLPPDRAEELPQTLAFMSNLGYVRMEEVPSIPRLPKTPAIIYYAPLARTTVAPDVVIAAGRPAQLMRLHEAAGRAGAAASLPLLGRPTCMALPAAMGHGAVMSTGCVGNRVYTHLGEDELYLMVPGARLSEIVEALAVIDAANEALAAYHLGRRESLTVTTS